MEMRTLGDQGLRVAAMGYGSMGTAVGYGPRDDADSIAAVRRAHELGVTMFDTAEMYGWGAGERLLGRAVAPFRAEVVLATKFGLTPDFGPDSRPAHIRQVLEKSLAALGVDHIDLLYQHRLDPQVPIEDVVGTMAEFVEVGTVRYLGLSEAGPDELRRAEAVHPISVLQTEYSLFARDADPLLPLLDELGIGFVAYSPLARGFLTGTARPGHEYPHDDFRAHMQWWDAEHYDHNTAIVDRLATLATDKGVTTAQLALAWVLARHEALVPIPGSRSPGRVTQNVRAADIALSRQEVADIADIAPTGAAGDRGSPSPWL